MEKGVVPANFLAAFLRRTKEFHWPDVLASVRVLQWRGAPIWTWRRFTHPARRGTDAGQARAGDDVALHEFTRACAVRGFAQKNARILRDIIIIIEETIIFF